MAFSPSVSPFAPKHTHKLTPKYIIIYTDGFTFGPNPSSKGGGFTLTDEYGNQILRRTINKEYFTCNEAELLGVLEALEIAEDKSIVFTDSWNTIYWVRRGACKARPDLNEYALKANTLLINKGINLNWVKREENYAGILNEQYNYN